MSAAAAFLLATAGVPAHVMSINQCADQLVLLLLPPARIASVTWLARDPAGSAMAAAAMRVPVNHGRAEEALRDRPDLVVAGAYTTPATRALLARLGYRVLVLPPAESIADIRAATRTLAAALGERARGEALVAAMDRRLAGLRRLPRIGARVAIWEGGELAGGPGTLAHDVLDEAGINNILDELGARSGGGLEALVAARPDIVIESSATLADRSRAGALARHPVVRRLWRGRTLAVDPAAFACGTPLVAPAAERLRAALARVAR